MHFNFNIMPLYVFVIFYNHLKKLLHADKMNFEYSVTVYTNRTIGKVMTKFFIVIQKKLLINTFCITEHHSFIIYQKVFCVRLS